MPGIDLRLVGEDCWPDLAGRTVVNLAGAAAPPIRLALRPGGMESGRASVLIRIDLPDGATVVAETSLRLLADATRAMREMEAAWRPL